MYDYLSLFYHFIKIYINSSFFFTKTKLFRNIHFYLKISNLLFIINILTVGGWSNRLYLVRKGAKLHVHWIFFLLQGGYRKCPLHSWYPPCTKFLVSEVFRDNYLDSGVSEMRKLIGTIVNERLYCSFWST